MSTFHPSSHMLNPIGSRISNPLSQQKAWYQIQVMSLLYHAWTRSPCQFPLDLCLINQNEPGTAICIEQDVGPGGRNESWNMKDHASPQTNDGLANFDFWPFGKGASHCKGHLHIVEVVFVCCFDERLWFCPGVELYITERCCLNMFFPFVVRKNHGIQHHTTSLQHRSHLDPTHKRPKGFPTKTPANHPASKAVFGLVQVWNKTVELDSKNEGCWVLSNPNYTSTHTRLYPCMSVAEDCWSRNGWLKYIEIIRNKSLVLVVLSPIFEPTCCNSAYTICLDLDSGSWWFMNPLSRIIYKNGQPWKWTVAILRLNSSSRVVPTFRGYVHSDRRVALEENR